MAGTEHDRRRRVIADRAMAVIVWLAFYLAAGLVLGALVVFTNSASARNLLIIDESGGVIAQCEYPVDFRNVEGGLVCRTPRLIFADSFEGTP